MTAFIKRTHRPNPVMQELARLQAEAARKERRTKKPADEEAEPPPTKTRKKLPARKTAKKGARK